MERGQLGEGKRQLQGCRKKLSAAFAGRPTPGSAISSERSLAVRLELRDDEATLTDERIDSAVAGVLETLRTRLGVRLRG